jgi:hypothetical protein
MAPSSPDPAIYIKRGIITGKERKKKKRIKEAVFTHFPVIAGGHPRDYSQVLGLHPLMLSDLADSARLALHGGTTADGFGVFV